jgi:RHS repeat-associated protein
MSDSGGPNISLPKGGGAIQGIGEKFSPDLHTGTGNFTIPIALPPGRNGFQPQLSLTYSTGNGNGPFGLGWGLSTPGVSRKISQGNPRYDNHQDVFLLSGSEDLVPVEILDRATRYRPRTEGLFAHIVHHCDSKNSYWEVKNKDGLISRYGNQKSLGTDPAVVADPSDRARVFSWRLTSTKDPFGNRIEYEYERDMVEEGPRHWDQLYLHRIRYCDYADGGGTKFLVSVSFEYELRPNDAFSEYRSGFEIRTRKRCTRIVIRTHTQIDQIVKIYEFKYADQRPELASSLPINGVSLLSTIKVTGYDGNETQSLPALELRYSAFNPGRRNLFPLTGKELPAHSLAQGSIELVDLFGQGLPDVLEMNGQARYWRNLGGSFDLPRLMHDAPGGLALDTPGVQLIDADGDGRTDLLVTTDTLSGYFPLCFGGLWDRNSFRRYRYAPTFNLRDPEVKLVDLDGDGITDAIRSGTRMECFFNHPQEGWNRTRTVTRRALEHFPNVNFSDPQVKWADMSGDGMQDIVLIHSGNIEYWPNLGHGDWGKRIHMADSPKLPYDYDSKRVLIGDIDGDGLADVVYVENTQVTIWINIGGRAWSKPLQITGTPPVVDTESVRLVDMLGSGIAGLLWSSDFGSHTRRSLYFLDFIGGHKPYLLNEVDNHIGAVTRIGYAPSTHYFLQDQKKPATCWRTTLPFPVQVVAQVEVIDQLSNGKLTTEYRYHHGYWDGAEREFRGFGMVEQIDSESFEHYGGQGLHEADKLFTQVDRKYFSAPTLTKTWFHQGPVGDEFGEWDELDWSNDYWAEAPSILGHTQAINRYLKTLPYEPNSRRVRRDALRTLRGSILRTELYALDGSLREDRPYTVTEYAYGLREEARPEHDSERLHIFFPYQTGQRTTQWERGHDPMTQFAFTDEFDAFGQPRLQIQIACPRGWHTANDRPTEPYLATCARTEYCIPVDPNIYIHDRVSQTISHELLQTSGKTIAEVRKQVKDGNNLSLIGQTVHYYDGAAFEGLPYGKVGSYGAAVRSESLAITDTQLRSAFGDNQPPYLVAAANIAWPAIYPDEFKTLLAPRAGYVFRSEAPYTEGFYIATKRSCYDFQQGLLPQGLVKITRDPMDRDTTVDYDIYSFAPVKITDAIGLTTIAEINYRLLQPYRIIDPNGSITEATFTPLGLVKASFVKGKNGEGDQARPGVIMEYGLDAFEHSPPNNRQPIFVHATRYIHHDTDVDVPFPERDDVIESYEYSDGFGRLLQTRAQAEDVIYGDEIFGQGTLSSDQTIKPEDFIGRRRRPGDPPNVVVNGWSVYDNKGRVVEAFEPFFSSGWQYRSPQDEAEQFGRQVFGNKVSTFYDPRGQVVRTLNPDGSEQRVVFGVPGTVAMPELSNPGIFEPTPWEAYTYDANDNAGRTHPATAATWAHHWNTPSSILIDALGRTIKSVARNRISAAGPTEEYRTYTTYDIRGNVITIMDALGREAFRYQYDFGNRRLRMDSIDAGVHKTVFDATGQAIEQSDDKGAWSLHGYDRLDRPSRTWARDDANSALSLRLRTDYGDGGTPNQPIAERAAQHAANRLGKPFRQYDEAGLQIFEQYDFRGNLIETERQVISDLTMLAGFAAPPPDWHVQVYRVDWQPPAGITLAAHASTMLDQVKYHTSTRHDALGRAKEIIYPQDVDGERKRLIPVYNRAGALERIVLDDQIYVDHIAYNVKGQRMLIVYGNGVLTTYAHDQKTFRLARMWSGRYSKPAGTPDTYRPVNANLPLQDLAYEYDLSGNILKIADRTPGCGVINTVDGPNALNREFDYDAIYRLISATGRESTNIPVPRPWTDDARNGYNSGNHGTANQDNAPNLTRRYTEQYEYDPVGNLLRLRHGQGNIAWTRNFGMGGFTPQQWQQQCTARFNAPNGWPNAPGNQLTHVGDDQTSFPQTHFFDDNGNLIRETSSRYFEWDYSDRLKTFRVQAGTSEPSVHAIYLYDAGGQRVKKLVRKQGGAYSVTVYVDGVFEHHRKIEGAELLENNSLHVMDDQSRVALIRVGDAFADDASPAIGYHLGDHLGNSSLVIDADAMWVNREEFTPFGESTLGSYSLKRYRFTGTEKDNESRLSYHNARYYASWLIKWCSCDPIGKKAHLNLYTYSHNPILYEDVRGTEPKCTTSTTHESIPPSETQLLNIDIKSDFSICKDILSGAQVKSGKNVQQPQQDSSANESVQTTAEVTITGDIPFEPEVSVPEIKARQEGIGKIEAEDVSHFFKGMWNGVGGDWLDLPKFNVHARHQGAELIGNNLGKNLALEGVGSVAARIAGKVLEATKPLAFAFLGTGIGSGIKFGGSKIPKGFITYIFKNKDGVRYVGRASGYGTAEEILASRLSKGHDVWKKFAEAEDLMTEILSVHGSRAAAMGAEAFYYDKFLSEGYLLLNKCPPLSVNARKLIKTYNRLLAFMRGD